MPASRLILKPWRCSAPHWTDIQDALIAADRRDYDVFEGRSFKAVKFAAWLERTGLPWPRLESGELDLRDDAFREAARAHPEVAPLRELRSALSELRLNDLAVGRDGRNRCLLSTFQARTGRNQPSNSKFIFGPSVWLRGLIKPPPGHGVAYIDWGQQEFGIAAALSGDANMLAAYRSGDPYLAFAKLAGAVPQDATKQTHAARARPVQGVRSGRPIRHGPGSARSSHWPAASCGARPVAKASGNLPGLSGAGRMRLWTTPCPKVRCTLCLAGPFMSAPIAQETPQKPHCIVQPAFPAEFSDAGQRRRNASAGLLLGHRARHSSVCTRARRGADLRTVGPPGRRHCRHAGGHG